MPKHHLLILMLFQTCMHFFLTFPTTLLISMNSSKFNSLFPPKINGANNGRDDLRMIYCLSFPVLCNSVCMRSVRAFDSLSVSVSAIHEHSMMEFALFKTKMSVSLPCTCTVTHLLYQNDMCFKCMDIHIKI